MGENITKLSPYHVFNYLFSGAIFAILCQYITSYSLVQDDLLTGLLLYSFIGLLINRISALVLEPILKWIRFVKFESYGDYVKASKKDPKIEVLSDQQSVLRTFTALPITLGVLKIYELVKKTISNPLPWDTHTIHFLLLIVILLLFLISYKKQTEYIVKRIKIALNDKE